MAESPWKMQERLWEEELFQAKDCIRNQDYERAQAWLERSATRAKNYFFGADARTATTVFHQARLAHLMGRPGEGHLFDREALAIRREALPAEAEEILESCCCIALFGPTPPPLGDEGAAEIGLHQRGLTYALTQFGEDSWQTFRIRGQLWALHHQVAPEAGESWLRQLRKSARTLQVQEAVPDEWGRLGDAACLLQAWPETAEFYTHSLTYREARHGKDSQAVAQTLAGVGQAYLLAGQAALGEASLRRALTLATQLEISDGSSWVESARRALEGDSADLEWVYSEPPQVDPYLGFGSEG